MRPGDGNRVSLSDFCSPSVAVLHAKAQDRQGTLVAKAESHSAQFRVCVRCGCRVCEAVGDRTRAPCCVLCVQTSVRSVLNFRHTGVAESKERIILYATFNYMRVVPHTLDMTP